MLGLQACAIMSGPLNSLKELGIQRLGPHHVRVTEVALALTVNAFQGSRPPGYSFWGLTAGNQLPGHLGALRRWSRWNL